MSILTLLADAATTQPVEPVPFWAQPSNFIFPLAMVMIVYFIFSSSKTRKTEQKKRDDMLANMKRGDRVLTLGGILGSVVEVRDTEVLLKVDESTNTKIKFTRDSIKRVITEEETSAPAK